MSPNLLPFRFSWPLAWLAASNFAVSAMAASPSQGPMLGDVTPFSARIWARWAADTSVSVRYRAVGASSFLSTAATKVDASTDFTKGFTLTGLRPGKTYEYRTQSVDAQGGAVESSSAYFRTPAKSPVALQFNVLTDFRSDLYGSSAVVAAGSPRPEFVAVIGDWDHRNPAQHPGGGPLYSPSESDAVLANLRQMHRDTRDPRTPIGADIHGAFIRSASPSETQVPLYDAWDDHDFCANNAGSTCPFTAASLTAYAEYFLPSFDNGLSDAAGCGAKGDWQSFRRGTLAEVFMLDARSNRVDGGTMLGACQLAWLENGLAASPATWKFILSPVTFNPGTKPWDSWAGFPGERQHLLDFVQSHHLTGIVIASGDIHSGGAIDDGSHSGLPEISVPHANMPGTSVNTFCRVEREGSTVLVSAPGTWSIGSLSDANVQIHGKSCLGKTYANAQVAALPSAPYPVDGTDNSGYLHVEVGTRSISLQVRDPSGRVRTGFRADGTRAPLQLDLTK